ncbi:MAG: hypothetical protein IJP48_03690 [Synergistaceae bacterium]|nr:hypothetical protein [Synergistaceae bacterium]
MIAGTLELIERGMKCLSEGLGDVEAEQFIAAVKREKFNYTEWQRNYFSSMSAEEFNAAAVSYEKENPFIIKK